MFQYTSRCGVFSPTAAFIDAEIVVPPISDAQMPSADERRAGGCESFTGCVLGLLPRCAMVLSGGETFMPLHSDGSVQSGPAPRSTRHGVNSDDPSIHTMLLRSLMQPRLAVRIRPNGRPHRPQ